MVLTGLPAVSAPLPWQGDSWQQLNRQREEGRLPHALLLCGMAGTGVDRLALALARLLLCAQPSGGLNCGKCHACQLSATGAHGEFLWLQPEEKSRVVKIDQVRDALHMLLQTASLGQRKVLVFSPADSLNRNAANALLKSLEEPPENTHVLLVSRQLHRLPATIRSRCQMLKLPTPTEMQSLEWLDGHTGDRSRSSDLLALAGGRPLLAETLYQKPDASDELAAALACRGLFSGQVAAADVVRVLAKAPVEEFFDEFLSATQAQLRVLPAAELQGATGAGLFALLDELSAMRRAVDGGANPGLELTAEVLVGKVQQIFGQHGRNATIGR